MSKQPDSDFPRTSPEPAGDRADAEPADEAFQLRLYIAGQTPKSLAAIANLQAICDTQLPGHYTIEVVDLTSNPELAAVDQIIAIPTLVRRRPPPLKRIIGSLSNTQLVLDGLEVRKTPK